MQEKVCREREAMMLFRKTSSSLMEDMASGQDLKVVKREICGDFGKNVPGKGSSKCKGSGAAAGLVFWRHSKEGGKLPE